MKSNIKGILVSFLVLAGLICGSCSAAAVEDSPFGIGTFLSWNHSWNNYMYKSEKDIDRAIALLKDLGVSIIRNEISWNEIETQPGVFDFKRYDLIVEKCRQNNIEILGILGYTAPWTGQEWNSAPKDDELFLNYVRTTVSRYKNSVKYWEFWNEPDSTNYWNPQDGMKRYTCLLKKVYATIKEVNPNAVVILGGLVQQPFYSLKKVLANGGAEYFDICNIHPYFATDIRSGVQRTSYLIKNITKEFNKQGIDKKIWITEVSCPGTTKPESCSWWLGQCQSEEEQAEFLTGIYGLLDTYPNLEKIFWSMFRDTEHFKDGIDSFGIIKKDYSLKPAYSVYKQIIEKYTAKR